MMIVDGLLVLLCTFVEEAVSTAEKELQKGFKWDTQVQDNIM